MATRTSNTRTRRKSSAAVIAAVLIVTLGLTGLLYTRAALTKVPEPRSPLTVETVPYDLQPSYQRQVSYLGLVVAGRKANITTYYPGSTPDRVEALITRPLEEELRKISEIDELHSISSGGVSFITILLFDTLPDEALDRAWSEIRDAIGDAEGYAAMDQG